MLFDLRRMGGALRGRFDAFTELAETVKTFEDDREAFQK